MEETQATRLLARLADGDESASEELMPLLYGELKRIAAENMAGERGGHTLQATALVHEAWLRLLGPGASARDVGGHSSSAGFNSREHFLRTAAQVMRRVLVDHARGRNSQKRGEGHVQRVEAKDLDLIVQRFDDEGTNLVELGDALDELARTDEELARVVELRTFGGLTMDEVAAVIGVSKATAERRARVARMWLADALSRDE